LLANIEPYHTATELKAPHIEHDDENRNELNRTELKERKAG